MYPDPGEAGSPSDTPESRTAPKPNQLMALKQLGLMGAVDAYVPVKSGELGEAMGLSQQTASLLLQSLEEQGLIHRQMEPRGQRVMVTGQGEEVLRREAGDFQAIFHRPAMVVIKGTVMTGLGEGKYYVTQDGYREQFRRCLGFAPDHGTLNLNLDGVGMEQLARLKGNAGEMLEGFTREGRTFGDVMCVKCSIRGLPVAVIIPMRTHHRNVMEIISEEHLRQRFALEDGDEVEVVVETGREP